MTIDLTLVQSFIAVAEELSFARAADRLLIAQPALSQRIVRFEDYLQMRLFNRTTRLVELTPQGEAVYAAAIELISDSNRFEETMGAVRRGKSEQLKVGYTASTGYDVVPRAVARFLHIHPEVDLVAREMWSREMIPAIEHGIIDVGVGLGISSQESSTLASMTLLEERMVIVMEDTHHLAARSSVRLEELRDETFMMFPPEFAPEYFSRLIELCEQAGFTPQLVDNPIPGTRAFSALCQNGVIALRPASARLMKPEGITFVDLEDEAATMSVVILWKHGRDDVDVIQKWIRNAIKTFDMVS